MKRKIKKVISVIILLLVIIVMVLVKTYIFKDSEPAVSVNLDNSEMKNPVDLSFSVLGDIHDYTDKFEKALDDLAGIRTNIDAMVLNGDMVDQGLDIQYKEMKDYIDKNSSRLPSIVIKNIGNHEFFDYAKGTNKDSGVNSFINKYLEFSGEKASYHDT